MWNEKIMCFTTSVKGGHSKPPFSSFNLGDHVGDNSQDVAKNRQELSQYLTANTVNSTRNVAPIKWLNQQHTTKVLDYSKVKTAACDAITSSEVNTPLAIMTADCLPIVMHCQSTNKLAAIHAGWRGLLSGIIQNTLKNFENTENIYAWIGPSISASAFEVSEDIIDQFSEFPECIQIKNTQKYLIDLPKIASHMMQCAGMQNIQVSPVCSYSNRNCFSHRRATHEGLSSSGRMATVIMRLY